LTFLQHTIEQSAWIIRITSLGGAATAGKLGLDRVCALIADQAETKPEKRHIHAGDAA
jgi:hypothetical protein